MTGKKSPSVVYFKDPPFDRKSYRVLLWGGTLINVDCIAAGSITRQITLVILGLIIFHPLKGSAKGHPRGPTYSLHNYCSASEPKFGVSILNW